MDLHWDTNIFRVNMSGERGGPLLDSWTAIKVPMKYTLVYDVKC